MAEKIIGIDLGTSNSAAAVIQGGKPTLIPAAEGTTVAGKAFPSIVAFSKDGDLLVGEPARRPVSYTHLRAHETRHDLVCRLLLE